MTVPLTAQQAIQCDAIGRLLGAEDIDIVLQGVELLTALDDPGLIRLYTDGLSIQDGVLAIARGTFRDHVQRKNRLTAGFLLARRAGLLENVKSLSFDNDRTIHDMHELSGLAGLDSLQSLCFSYCLDMTSLQGVPVLGGLTSLTIKSRTLTRLGDLTGTPALSRLSITYSNRLQDISALHRLTSLVSITLEGCITLQELNSISSLPRLTSLVLRGCSSVTDLSALRNLPALAHLDLSYCAGLVDLASLPPLPALTTLSVEGCSQLSSLGDLTRFPALKTLHMARCTALPKAAQQHARQGHWRVVHGPCSPQSE